jgi:hypothetical protein
VGALPGPGGAAGGLALTDAKIRRAEQASLQLNEYLTGLVEARRTLPGDDLLSGLVAGPTPDGRMTEADVLSTMRLLLVAGHETTVNLSTNGMLTMLRHPDVLDRLRADSELVVPLVEEVLRYDPPVQFRTRTTLADLPVAGTTIPQGATVVLLLASGSRDPHRFPRPGEFVPDRAWSIGAASAAKNAPSAAESLASKAAVPSAPRSPAPCCSRSGSAAGQDDVGSGTPCPLQADAGALPPITTTVCPSGSGSRSAGSATGSMIMASPSVRSASAVPRRPAWGPPRSPRGAP